MLLVITLDIDSIPSDVAVEDLVDLTSLHVASKEYADIYIVVQMSNDVAPSIINTICNRLAIDKNHIYQTSGSDEIVPSADIIAGVMLYLHDGCSAVSIYNANNDIGIDIDAANINKPAVEISQILKDIDFAYSRQDIYTFSSLINSLTLAMRRSDCGLAVGVRVILKPLSIFLDTYLKLMLRLSSDNMEWTDRLRDEDSFKSIHPATMVKRLVANHEALDHGLQSNEFIREAVRFFKVGDRYFDSVIHSRGRDQRQQATVSALAWLSTYSNMAAREALNARNYRVAFLHIFRCLEFYFLAGLWRSKNAAFEGGRLKLDDHFGPNLKDLWVAFQDARILTVEATSAFENLVEDLRQHRNRNLLIHGFNDPDEGIIRRARHSVNRTILQYEQGLIPDQKLITGPLAICFKNERWSDTIGKMIVQEIIGLIL